MWSLRKIFGCCLFLSSYVVLHYGLYGALVMYDHELKVDKKWFDGTKDEGLFDSIVFFVKLFGNKPIKLIPPTTRSLIGDLPPAKKGDWPQWSMLHCLLDKADKGESSYVAPYTLLCFGVYLPLLKFVSVVYWMMCLPGSKQVLQFAKVICRWAAVDAVAEAMIVALLLRGGVHAEHKQGYVCFVGFCILSTISIWIMKENSQPHGPGLTARMVLWSRQGRAPPRYMPLLTLLLFLAAFFNAVAFFPLASISVPTDPIKYNIHDVVSHHHVLMKFVGEHRLDRLVGEIVDSIPKVYGVASVFEAAQALLFSGHEYTVAGSIFLLIGVLICPLIKALHAFVLATDDNAGAMIVPSTGDESVRSQPSRTSSRLLFSGRALRVAKGLERSADLSLLDVYCFGMFVAALVLGAIGDVLYCELLAGFYLLIPAVLLSYVHQAVCWAMVLARSRGPAKADLLHVGDEEDASLLRKGAAGASAGKASTDDAAE